MRLFHLLNNFVQYFIKQIFDIVQDILKFDKSVEVRRAAALLTTQILQGTSKETFHVSISLYKIIHQQLFFT